MNQVIIDVEESKYALFLQLIQSLDYVKVVSAKPVRVKKSKQPKYDFSDIAGQLHWKGDALMEQRGLRDEW